MIFNSLIFLFAFLPVVLVLGLWIFPGNWRAAFLTGASFVFYAYAGVFYAVLFAATLAWVYLVTLGSAQGSRWRLAAAIVPPLVLLIYYKYSGFLLHPIFRAAASDESFSLFQNVALPAGISFYTFTLIAFAVDRYRGTIPAQPRFWDVCLYISFFPHLVAGPILRYAPVRAALEHLPKFRLNAADALQGLGYVVVGLAAKVLVADTLANAIAPFVETPSDLSPSGAAFVLLGYSFQIYFDFYGYSLAAIGLAKFFGFDFPANFLRPYESANPREFWRRWHVTLSFWIRDYVYLPLGGNTHYTRNIILTFALCGLWHGAGWNFMVWGLYHGALVVGYRAVRPTWDALPSLLQVFITFALVTLGWSLFLYDFSGASELMQSLAGFGGTVAPPAMQWSLVAAAVLICFSVDAERLAGSIDLAGWRPAAVRGAWLAALSMAILLFLDRSHTFIYFRF